MTEKTETKTDETVQTVQKSDEVKIDSMADVVSDLIKTKDALIEKQESEKTELLNKIAELEKVANKNPVEGGIEQPQAIKATDADDVGTKADAKNDIAPKPSEAQATIIAPAGKPSGSDNAGVSLENKSDDDDDKKAPAKEEEDAPAKKEEEKDMKKSDSTYKVVETVRPLIKARADYSKVPTAYQMLKAVENGFGQTKSADQSLVIMYNKMINGEFGDGYANGGGY